MLVLMRFSDLILLLVESETLSLGLDENFQTIRSQEMKLNREGIVNPEAKYQQFQTHMETRLQLPFVVLVSQLEASRFLAESDHSKDGRGTKQLEPFVLWSPA